MVVRVFILLVSLSIAYSCNTTQETTSQDEPVIFAGAFIVNTLYDQPMEDGDLNLQINDRTSKISGFSGCNTYSVAFTKTNNTITFSPAIGTKILCDEEAMKKERQFLNIFAGPKEFSIKKDTLILYNEGKEILKATHFIF